MKNTNSGCVEQRRSWMQAVCELVNEIFGGFDGEVTKSLQNDTHAVAANPMVRNVDGSYTFNGRKCLLVDNGGRIMVVWL